MEPSELRRWIEQHDTTVSALARDLGISRRTLHRYLDGSTPIPRMLEMALEVLETK